MVDLSPKASHCPCCDSEASLIATQSSPYPIHDHSQILPTLWKIICKGCGLQTKEFRLPIEALEVWNSRKDKKN